MSSRPAATETIAVNALQVGMFVHLDLSWMSHPFMLSSFRISSEEQIATIRSLGLREVRWSRRDSLVAQPSAESQAPAAAVPLGPQATPAERERAQRREHAAAERAALRCCENQFNEALNDSRLIERLLHNDPQQAGALAGALTKALVNKMVGKHDLCLRVLSDASGPQSLVHGLNVAIIALLTGRALGLSTPELHDLGVGALMHDAGKVELPQRLWQQAHPTSAERRAYEGHVARGVALAAQMGLSAGAQSVIGQHHECADGSGFPGQVKNERMALGGRVVALVNRFDNLCNPHVPGHALTPHEALSYLFAQSQHKFDAAVLAVFIKMMGVYPPGSIVELSDGRHGVVASVNISRPLKPRLLVHDPEVPRDEAVPLDLESPQAQGLSIRRSLNASQLPEAALIYLSPRPRALYFFEPASAASTAAPRADHDAAR